jgi:bifunctional non-homologous end joining protein LigD
MTMGLEDYDAKRDFSRTPEPRGKSGTGRGYSFVVQKHAATRLHYDFRLELENVLKSWAIPKGPSYDTREKRLAVHVEDHPVEYGSFEGIIPKDEYGGGTVMIWDTGVWAPLDQDPVGAYRKGVMKFRLQGKKLQGAWTLIRMKPRPGEKESRENWLLIKERDELARPLAEFDVTKAFPDSAVSGRSIEEIAADEDDVWHSEPNAFDPEALRKLPGAREAKLPDWVAPELATLAEGLPGKGAYIYEIKLDGYRQLCRIDGREVRFLSRSGKDWTDKFPSLALEARRLAVRSALLDGEVIAAQADGTPSFQALQNALSESGGARLIYYVFDLLYVEGFDVRQTPLSERKRLARELLAKIGPTSRIRYLDHVEGDPRGFFAEVCKRSLEGIMCKRPDRPYISERTKDWLKIKCWRRQEFVVGGFTEPSGGRKGLGALLLGLWEKDKRLQFVGRVGTGFTERSLKELRGKLSALETPGPAFANPPRGAAARGVHWVSPELVAEVSFADWTADGQLRHPSFEGLREDKRAEDVGREEPQKTPGDEEAPAEKTTAKRHSAGETERVAGVTLTNPGRLLYPEVGVTKREIAEYYVQIADRVLPYVKDRPLTLVRCPDGWNQQCFFQKRLDTGVPASIATVPIIDDDGEERQYLAIRSLEGLVFCVQRSVLEFHPWGARIDNLDRPDIMIFDLDPGPSIEWARVAETARLVRGFLELLGLRSFLKTTGSRGLHVVVPLARRHSWGEVKSFSKAVVERFVQAQPELYTANASKAARQGRIYLDYLRNSRGANAIAPYSTRAKAGAPVATPIAWEELDSGVRSDSFTIRDIPGRLRALSSDPWEEFRDTRQTISATARRKVGLKKGGPEQDEEEG